MLQASSDRSDKQQQEQTSPNLAEALLPSPGQQTWLTGKNAVPVRLNPIGQHDENNCLACVA